MNFGQKAFYLRDPILADYEILASWIFDATSCAHWAGPKIKYPFQAPELPLLISGGEVESFSMVDENTKFVGFGQLVTKGPRTLRLARIIVAPNKRGRGFGRKLVELLLEEASSRSHDLITLGVYRENLAAISLYSSLGFSQEVSTDPQPRILNMYRCVDRR